VAKRKNPAAVALGKRRWAGKSKAERKAELQALAAKITPEAATARAKKAWETKRRKAQEQAGQ
jgi:hypothetical protein